MPTGPNTEEIMTRRQDRIGPNQGPAPLGTRSGLSSTTNIVKFMTCPRPQSLFSGSVGWIVAICGGSIDNRGRGTEVVIYSLSSSSRRLRASREPKRDPIHQLGDLEQETTTGNWAGPDPCTVAHPKEIMLNKCYIACATTPWKNP